MSNYKRKKTPGDTEWFVHDRFGMFIHFGLYAHTGWHEQIQLRRGIPKEEYIKLREVFNPSKFDAEEMVTFAKNSGAQYICFTAKHHDGFCMWDTKFTDYSIKHPLRQRYPQRAGGCLPPARDLAGTVLLHPGLAPQKQSEFGPREPPAEATQSRG